KSIFRCCVQYRRAYWGANRSAPAAADFPGGRLAGDYPDPGLFAKIGWPGQRDARRSPVTDQSQGGSLCWPGGLGRDEHGGHRVAVAGGHAVDADHPVDDHVLEAVQRLLEAVAHAAAGVGRVGDSLLDPFDDLEVLPVDQVPETFELVQAFAVVRITHG